MTHAPRSSAPSRSPSARASRTGSAVLAAVTLLVLSAALQAAPRPQQPSLSGLEAALQDRISQIPGRLEARPEGGELRAALRSLGAYQGLVGGFTIPDAGQLPAVLADLGTLADVAVHVERSRTADAGVLFHVDAVRDTIDGFGFQVRQVALVTAPLLLDDVVAQEVEEFVDEGDELRLDGLDRWDQDRRESTDLLLAALGPQHKAARLAKETEMCEAKAFPVDIEPMAVMPPDSGMAGANEPFELDVQIAPLSRPVPELTVALRAIAMPGPGARVADGGQSAGGAAPAPQFTLGAMTLLDVQPGESLPPMTVEVPPFADEARRAHAGPQESFQLGYDVDVDGDTAVIGSFDGAVAVLERFEGGIDGWQVTDWLLNPEADGDRFGSAVAISGDTIVVGAPANTTVGSGHGAVYVFERGPDGSWTLAAGFGPPAVAGITPARFGAAVDIDGDRIVVGAPDTQIGCPGAAYTFSRVGRAWQLEQDLSLDIDGNEVFSGREGTSVALDGHLLVVGGVLRSPSSMLRAGCRENAVWIYEFNGERWVMMRPTPLTGPDPQPRDSSTFGQAVAVDATTRTVVVGEPGYDSESGLPDIGAVHVYETDDGVWFRTEMLNALPAAYDLFGTSVAITSVPAGGDPLTQMIVVGSPGQDQFTGVPQEQDSGSVYMYVRGHQAGCDPAPMPQDGNWGLLARRVSDAPVAGGAFGRAVAVSSAHTTPFVVDGEAVDLQVPATIVVGEPFGLSPELGLLSGQAHVFSGMNPVAAGPYQLAVEVDPHGRVLEMDGDDAEGNNLLLPGPVDQVNTITSQCVVEDSISEYYIAVGKPVYITLPMGQNASAALIQSRLEELPNVAPGDVIAEATMGSNLSQAGAVVTLRWMGNWAGRPVPVSLLYTGFGSNQFCWELATTTPGGIPVLNVCVPCLDCVDLSFEPGAVQLVPDESDVGFIIAGPDGTQLTRAGVNVTVRADGAFEGPLRGARVSVALDFDGIGSGTEYSANILNPQSGAHDLEFFVLEDLLAGDVQSAHLDIDVSGPVVMIPPGQNSANLNFDLVVKVEFDGVDLDEDDNEAIRQSQNWTVIRPATECDLSRNFEKRMGNDLFNVGLDFRSSLNSASEMNPIPVHDGYPGAPHGAIGSLAAEAGFTVFGKAVDKAVEFDVTAERDPLFQFSETILGYSYLDVSLKTLGYIVYSVGPLDSFDLALPDEFPDGLMAIGSTGFRLDTSIGWGRSWPTYDVWCCLPRSQGGEIEELSELECCRRGGRAVAPASQDQPAFCIPPPEGPPGPCTEVRRLGRTFYPGGVPVDVDAEADGELKLVLGVQVCNDMQFEVGPGVAAGVTVDVELPADSPFRAGVTGEVTLVDIERRTITGLGMQPFPGVSGIGICFMQFDQIVWTIQFLSGRITASAVTPWFEWLGFSGSKTWGPYPVLEWDAPLAVEWTEGSPNCRRCGATGPVLCPMGECPPTLDCEVPATVIRKR